MAARIRGMNRLLSQIRNLPNRLNGARNEALRDWAEALEKTAKDLAPVRSGDLRRDIKAKVNTSSGKAWVGVYGSATQYAYYVEKGTSKMADQPYLGPAAQIHRRTGERAVSRAVPRWLGGR
ncbi:HK97-gp10 family putative phage morphogenesis protein [Streptomyces sp. NPDC000851]